MERRKLALLVPRPLVKTVKTALEQKDYLDRKFKITPEENDHTSEDQTEEEEIPRMRLLTTIPIGSNIEPGATPVLHRGISLDQKPYVLAELELLDLQDEIQLVSTRPSTEDPEFPVSFKNPLLRALAEALDDLPEQLLAGLELSSAALVNAFPTTYTIYKPMLLLPAHTFTSPPWTKLLSAHPPSSPVLAPLWTKIASSVGTTHIAVNSGIPPSTSTSTKSSESKSEFPEHIADPSPTNPSQETNENILRAPLNITPIHNSFGPPPTPTLQQHPTKQDFDAAFWVSTTQNGIQQVWAPLYTMFSRGNIREKTRVLNLPSVKSAVADGEGRGGKGCSAVDLYSGIGYFSFCYRKAGVKRGFCWELNPWSVEGFRRGAELNGWTTKIFHPPYPALDSLSTQRERSELEDVDFLVFQESNEAAAGVIAQLRKIPHVVPPVRHVNCGFLPSSNLSWRTAVRVLDKELGGWIHAHENVGVDDIEARKEEVVREMQGYLDELEMEKGGGDGRRRGVMCEHVERVKTYAPGVLHVVFDIRVDGRRDLEEARS